jgi:hypothetical protein
LPYSEALLAPDPVAGKLSTRSPNIAEGRLAANAAALVVEGGAGLPF